MDKGTLIRQFNLFDMLLFTASIFVIVFVGRARVAGDKIQDGDSYLEVVCDGQTANLSCPEGKYIAILLANYGRFTIHQCNPSYNTEFSTTCQNDKTLGILQQQCNGKNSCEVEVSERNLGDPCPKTLKYLEVKYECTALPVTTTISTTTTTTAKTSTMAVNVTDLETLVIAGQPPFIAEKHQKKQCIGTEFREIDWPTTDAGRIGRARCPVGADGVAEWECKANGEWSDANPDLSKCTSSWSRQLRDDADGAEDPKDQMETLREIKTMTRKLPLLGGDLIALSTAIDSSIPAEVNLSTADHFSELVVESVNNMAKESQSPAWSDLNDAKCRKTADSLMDSVNKIAAVVSSVITAETTKTVIKPTIELEISNVRVHEYVTFPSMSLYKSTYDTVDIPKEALTLRSDTQVNAKVIYVTYSSMGSHMEPKSHIDEDGTVVERKIASKIVSASIVNTRNKIQRINQLRRPVIITFRMKAQANLSSPICVWWNSTGLSWSPSGCNLMSHNKSHTVCYCDHLTHYAVLMDIRGQELPYEHDVALTFITYAGCSLSIVCLALSLLAFICFGSGGGDRICIHKNLCFSLLAAETLFLFGIWQTSSKLYCGLIAGALHYLFLAVFAWMLLEGFELYYMLIEVFRSKDSKKRFLYLFGYGAPALIVGISVWIDRFSYGTDRYCWLRADNSFVLTFVGPAAAILLCNCVFLVMTLCIVCRHSNIGYTPCRQDRDTLKDIRSWLKGAVALVFLLGLTWTFGLFWVDQQSVSVAYIFTVLNSLQGLFIFLFHVVFNDRLQKDYSKWARRSSWLPDCVRESSIQSRPSAPYVPSAGGQQGFSSNSSTGSELLYPTSMIEKYPQRLMAAIDPRYSNSVQMMIARHGIHSNGVYDYATIPYGDLCTQPPRSSYFNPMQEHFSQTPPLYSSPPSQYRPPPNFPPPPPPPAPGCLDIRGSPRPHSSALTKVSDDSAYSDSSTLHYPADATSSSGMLLRMDLTKNPPVFVQGV